MDNTPAYMQKENVTGYIFTESSGEYTLPDYQGEIRKILKVDTRILPSGKFAGGDRAEFAGVVSHTVIYSDAEGHLSAVNLDSDYEFSFPIDAADGCEFRADSTPDSVVCRLSGPRKLSLRTKIRSAVHVLTPKILCEELCGQASVGSVERRIESVNVMETHFPVSDDIILSDSETISGVSPEGLRVVYCTGDVLVRECKARDGSILCRGDVYLKCICTPDGQLPFPVSKKIPFETDIAAYIDESYEVLAYGRCSGVNVTVSADGGGGAVLTFDANATVECEMHRNASLPYVSDVFSTERACICEKKEISTNIFAGGGMGNFSIDGSALKSELGAEAASRIVDCIGKIEIESVENRHGRAAVNGKCNVCMIFCDAPDESGNAAMSSAEFSFPFRVDVDCKLPDGDFICECHGDVTNCRGRIDASSLIFDGEVAITVRATREETIRTVEKVEFSPEAYNDVRTGITIYYPSSGEDIWDVAKKYHVHPSSLAETNSLAGKDGDFSHISLDGAHNIIIA